MINLTKVAKTKFDNLAKTPLTAPLNANHPCSTRKKRKVHEVEPTKMKQKCRIRT